MKRVLLIDADTVAYRASAGNQETFKWEEGVTSVVAGDIKLAVAEVDHWLGNWKERFNADDLIICLSCASQDGWRVKVLPTYKAHRAGMEKPALMGQVKEHLRRNYRTFERPALEADDILGILATHPTLVPGKKMIVSIDKDLKTIPGWLFNPAKHEKPVMVTEQEADYWHMYQTLVGDSTDGYKGCPGIGPKKAEKILNGTPQWSDVWDTFAEKGIQFSDALVQAQVARICRHTDYDFQRKEVKLWQPPSQSPSESQPSP